MSGLRVSVAVALVALAFVSSGCPGRPKRPEGPPPEYERPVVMPWDSGAPVDPLDNVEGEEVTDDEPDAASAPADAGSG